MITLVNGKGVQVNEFQFLDWEEAENYLTEQREKGKRDLYLRGDFVIPTTYDGVYLIVVGFADDYSMVIKAKHLPCPDEIMNWIESDMKRFGYSDIFEYYVTDEDDVYTGYDTDNIDNWPIFGV